ncbi:MAG: OmpA family protein, partial [Bacteroidota bacterium]
MTRRLNYFCALALMMLFATLAVAQPKPITDDDVVQDPDGQHREWKKGTQKYPSKPKDMIEIGLHGGSFLITGDVVPEFGWAAGLHIRKSLGYSFSLRLNGFYGIARGLNHNPNRVGAYSNPVLRNVGSTGYGRSLNGNAGSGLPWYHNYKTSYTEVSLQGVITLNNLKFHKERNKWNLYGIFGIGTHIYTAKYDALNGEGNTYAEFATVPGQFDVSEGEGRRDARQRVREILDGDYETNAEQWDGLFKLFDLDDATMNLIANLGVGLGYKISNRINLTLEHQVTLSDDDLIDGYRWAEQGDLTRSADLPQYTSLRIGINLGSFDKRVEPLWWVNPLDAPYEAIAKNTQKDIDGLFDDDDGDGVVNKVDREPDTPADCPVDTRGVTLDSDGDGVADCNDKEPYSPPGYPVDGDGIAQVNPPLTDPDIVAIGEREGWG